MHNYTISGIDDTGEHVSIKTRSITGCIILSKHFPLWECHTAYGQLVGSSSSPESIKRMQFTSAIELDHVNSLASDLVAQSKEN